MSILSKLWTLFRGSANEAGQAVVDKNAIRILDQEMRDAESALLQSRDDLTRIMAQHKLATNKLADKKAKASEYSSYIQQLLLKNDRALATDVAAQLAPLEGEIGQEQQVVDQLASSITTLRATIKNTESGLQRLKHRVQSVKTTESVQKAQAALAASHSGSTSKMRTAIDSLDRLQQRQSETAARMEAAHELASDTGDADLRRRLAAAGIGQGEPTTDSILARFTEPAAITHEQQQVIDVEVTPVADKLPRS